MPDRGPVEGTVVLAIQTLREARNMSISELARRADMSRGKLYRILDGQPLTLDDVWALARGLDVAPADVLPLADVSAESEDGSATPPSDVGERLRASAETLRAAAEAAAAALVDAAEALQDR